jgi:DNA-binding GntR family transcriptional regulator
MLKDINLSAKVYKNIKNMLITLVFPPGMSLRERVLADMMGVSRTPIREALQRLSHEGWVQIGDRKRIYVCPVTVVDVKELFQLRHLLEPSAARMTIEKGGSRILAGKLDEVLNVMEQVQNDQIAFARLDMQFHSLLMKNLENERINRFWITLYEEISRIAIMTLTEDHRRSMAVIDEHAKFVDAFWKKDIDLIIDAITYHLTQSCNTLVSKLNEAGSETFPEVIDVADNPVLRFDTLEISQVPDSEKGTIEESKRISEKGEFFGENCINTT